VVATSRRADEIERILNEHGRNEMAQAYSVAWFQERVELADI
jgi:hypothetical protein